MVLYSGAWGKLIHEKNQKQKISWHCPFKCLAAIYTELPQKLVKFIDDVIENCPTIACIFSLSLSSGEFPPY